MRRIWALVGALIVGALLMFFMSGFVGSQSLLTMGLCLGGGAAAAYLVGEPGITRGLWLFAGATIGTLTFALSALSFPDTNFGLFLGAAIPTLIAGVATTWTRDPSAFLAATIGSGAMSGVYANVFNADPQSLNVSLPIALGWTLLPLGFGYLAGTVARNFTGDKPEDEPAATGSDDNDDLGETQQIDTEAVR